MTTQQQQEAFNFITACNDLFIALIESQSIPLPQLTQQVQALSLREPRIIKKQLKTILTAL